MRELSLIFNETLATLTNGAQILFDRIRSCGRSIKIGTFSFFAIISLIMSVFFAGATIGYRVNYNGKTIATVLNKQQFDTAAVMVTRSLNHSESETYNIVKKPVFTTAFVLSGDIDSNEDIAAAIIDNTAEIVSATAVVVNGNVIGCTDNDLVYSVVEECRNRFNIAGYECVSSFVDDVALSHDYYLCEEILTIDEITEKIMALSVSTNVVVSTDSVIPFKTVKQQNASLERGKSNILVAGSNGVMRTGETVTYVNGVEVSRVQNNATVIAQPVDRVIEVGTAKKIVKNSITVSGLVFPLERGSWQVSAYFGDGRNHQAVDLRAPAGTSIYAVKSGTVVQAGWDGNYGYSIVIDHGSGFKTRYAHESTIYVSKGDVVSAGEVIGTVGRTGNATGNHLHFEIIINGVRIDPAPSLGLY
ncbi:MAG: hypothetical protein E7562_01980 [Ruminococcaceae bacterium]|nr:hypothetical protein [Oscillospiraceae bacterium]